MYLSSVCFAGPVVELDLDHLSYIHVVAVDLIDQQNGLRVRIRCDAQQMSARVEPAAEILCLQRCPYPAA